MKHDPTICPKCKGKMRPLFTTYYCPLCELQKSFKKASTRDIPLDDEDTIELEFDLFQDPPKNYN